jgi:alpha-tubulin suppressor-like RCC1 family protein
VRVCVVAAGSGDVYVWGWNHAGQLGSGNTTGSTTPVLLDAITEDIRQVYMLRYLTFCVVTDLLP